MDIPKILTNQYDYLGQIIGLAGENTFFPYNGAHWHSVQQAIAEGITQVEEPVIKNVQTRRKENGELLGYRWDHLFVPKDETNKLYMLIESAINQKTCIVEEHEHSPKGMMVSSVIFAVLLSAEWEAPPEDVDICYSYQLTDKTNPFDLTIRCLNFGQSTNKSLITTILTERKIVCNIPPENLSLILPESCNSLNSIGYLEVEIPINHLQRIFKAARNENLLHLGFIEDLFQQELLEYDRTVKKGPRTEWLIQMAHLFLPRIVYDIACQVVEKYPRGENATPQRVLNTGLRDNSLLMYFRMADEAIVFGCCQGGERNYKYQNTKYDLEQALSGNVRNPFAISWIIRDFILQRQPLIACVFLNSFYEVKLKVQFYNMLPDPQRKRILHMPLEYFIKSIRKAAIHVIEENRGQDPNVFLPEGLLLRDIPPYLLFLDKLLDINKTRDQYIHLLAMPGGNVFSGVGGFSGTRRIKLEDDLISISDHIGWPHRYDGTEHALVGCYASICCMQESIRRDNEVLVERFEKLLKEGKRKECEKFIAETEEETRKMVKQTSK